MPPSLSIIPIVAVAQNGVIGLNGKMPWHLPEELRHFRRVTLNGVVLMGRKTYESIGKPLPGRTNLILSSSFKANGCISFSSVAEVKSWCHSNGVDKLFVIGGATLYKIFLPEATQIYYTEIQKDFEGDTFFESFNKDLFRQFKLGGGVENNIAYTFYRYDRIEDA